MIRVTGQPIDAGDELAKFLASAGEGAIASFVGTVRGGEVEALTLDHYPGFTEKELERIVEETRERHDLSSASVVHRFGAMLPGETIMFAATAAPHRRAALDALDELMDRLKHDAPFWKREQRGGKEHWLDPSEPSTSKAAPEMRMSDDERVGVAVLTVSDTRDEASDTSGKYLADSVAAEGHRLAGCVIVADDIEQIRAAVRRFVDDAEVDVIISTGGTGLTGRDVTPEAVLPLFDKVIEGFAVVWHRVSFDVISLSTMQSRACAGVIGSTLVFCLPGSNGAVRDGWTKVIGPQLNRSAKPCNFVEIMPRLSER